MPVNNGKYKKNRQRSWPQRHYGEKNVCKNSYEKPLGKLIKLLHTFVKVSLHRIGYKSKI